METLHQGWLVKSPPLDRPPKHPLFKARWRRRFFVLYTHSKTKECVLEYFTDDTKKKLKGKIYLEDTERVDSGLTIENGKQKYDYMFGIKTPHRIYYLAADTVEEMTHWVKIVCSVCSLRDEEDSRTISNPYILISDCISGPPGPSTKVRSQSVPHRFEVPLTNPRSYSATSDSRVTISTDLGEDSVFEAPSRPPKPPHLSNETYANLLGDKIVIDDSMTPPFISRSLKPERRNFKVSDFGNKFKCMTMGPPVQRKLKPKNSFGSTTVPRQWNQRSSSADDASTSESGSRRNSVQEEEQIYFYIPRVDSLNGQYPPMMIPAESFENKSIAYIDLELPHPKDEKRDINSTPNSSTVYKTVDFVKTEAFNRTRQTVEEKYDGAHVT